MINAIVCTACYDKGGTAMLSFTMEEYQDRLRKTKQRMEASGIEVLLISDPANMNYLTGYDGCIPFTFISWLW